MKRLLLLAMLLMYSAPADGQVSTLLLESFDSVTAPDIPPGVSENDVTWKTSSSSASPGSGANNLVHTGSTPGQAILGPIDLSAQTEATLTYWARRTASYPADSLIVRFSNDGGITFPHLFTSGGLPATASTYEQVSINLDSSILGFSNVHLLFEGRGGSSSGSNMRIDDVQVTTPLDLGSIEAQLGFQDSMSTWNLASNNHIEKVDLSWPGPDSIQGFQFDLTFDTSFIRLDSVHTSGLLADASWHVSSAPNRVIALQLETGVLPPGAYPGMLSLHFSWIGEYLSADSLLSIGLHRPIVSSSAPSGSGLFMPGGNRTLSLHAVASMASISTTTPSVDFGLVVVGDSASISLDLNNASGSTDLIIHGASATHGTISAGALPSAIPPQSSGQQDFTFIPSYSSYGLIEGNLTVFHNATGDSLDVPFTAVGIGGRGDTDADGSLDVADVILGLDAALGLTNPLSAEFPRFDLYPFPTGDGVVDVRDLTVQIQAILRATWPDSMPLPTPPNPASAGKSAIASLSLQGSPPRLLLNTKEDLRGYQIRIETRIETLIETLPGAPPLDASKTGQRTSSYFDQESGVFSLLSVFELGNELPLGSHELALIDQHAVMKITGLAVTDAGEKIELDWNVSTDSERTPLPTELSIAIYPNPYSLSTSSNLNEVPSVTREVSRITVYDMLGRKVFAQSFSRNSRIVLLRNEMPDAPGLYVVRWQSGTDVRDIPLMLIR